MLCKKTVEIGDSYGDTAAGGSYKKLYKQFLACFEENEKHKNEKMVGGGGRRHFAND